MPAVARLRFALDHCVNLRPVRLFPGVVSPLGDVPIDMVVVNLYPFAATVAKPDCSYEDAVENIDIGGPAMLRSAAKNFARVAVATDPSQYDALIAELRDNAGTLSAQTRFSLAVAAFNRVAQYDGAISDYLLGPNPRYAEMIDRGTVPRTVPSGATSVKTASAPEGV